MRVIFASFVLIALWVPQLPAQSLEELRGTWSGDWLPTSGPRDRVTVEFQRDGETLTGRLLNPIQAELSRVEFDPGSGRVVAEATDEKDSTRYRLEVVFEEELTRMSGTMSAGTQAGEVKLVKWTYVPRLR